MTDSYFKCWNCEARLPIDARLCIHTLPCGCSYSWLKPSNVRARSIVKLPGSVGIPPRYESVWEADGLGVTYVHPVQDSAISGWRELAVLMLQTNNQHSSNPVRVTTTSITSGTIAQRDEVSSLRNPCCEWGFTESQPCAIQSIGKVEAVNDDGTTTIRMGGSGAGDDFEWRRTCTEVVSGLSKTAKSHDLSTTRRVGWADNVVEEEARLAHHGVWSRTYARPGETLPDAVSRIAQDVTLGRSDICAQVVDANTIAIHPVTVRREPIK